MDEYSEQFANPFNPARRGYVDDVIEPHETRSRLVADLAATAHRPSAYPEAPHANIPL